MPALVGVTAVVAGTLALILYLGERQRLGWPPTAILGVALLLRLFFLFSPPQLSDDLYRYLWDGHQLLLGSNPYAAAPTAATTADAELEALRRQVNHPDLVTIYPPAAQLVFAAGALLGGMVSGMKLWLVLLDLAACGLLLRLLDRLGLPRWRAVLYAWNPLPVLEIAGSGHIDGVGSLLLLVACLLVVGRPDDDKGARYAAAGAFLAAAGLVKLFPFALLPAFLCLVPAGRRHAFLAGFAGLTAALLLPFLPELRHLGETLAVYARHWEFAGLAFTLLRRLTGSGTTARLLLIGGFGAILAALLWRLWRRLRLTADNAGRGRLLVGFCAAAAMAFLLLTPTLQPWYALVLAAFLPFCAGPASLVLCWSVFLAYRVLLPYAILGQWQEDAIVTALVFLAPVAAGGLSRLLRRPGAPAPA